MGAVPVETWMHDQMIRVMLTGSVNLSSYVNYVGVYLSSEWWLKDTDQSTIRCQLSPLKPSRSAPFSIATLRGILVPLFHTAVVNYTMSDSKIASHTSHLRRSTFKGGAAAPRATLAWQTRRDSSFATALFWLRHGANAPGVGCSGGKLFLQSVLSCLSWREGVRGGLMGCRRNVGRGCTKALWGTEQRPEVSHFPVQSCGTWLRAEGRSFDVSGFDVPLARMNGPWRVDSQRACEFKWKRSEQRGLNETGTEKPAISPSSPARGGHSITWN